MKIGPFLIIKAADMPFYSKAHRLARALSEDQLDDILAGKCHIHRNPGKRKVKDFTEDDRQEFGPMGFPDIKYPKAGE